MKIAINTISVKNNTYGGRIHLLNLIENLIKIDRKNGYYLIVTNYNKKIFSTLQGKNLKRTEIPLSTGNYLLRLFYEQVYMPIIIRKLKIDVLITPANFTTLFPGIKSINIIAIYYKNLIEKFPKIRSFYYRILLPLSAKRVDQIITVSNSMKNLLIEDLNINPDKIKVIYEGVNTEHFTETHKLQSNIIKYKPYILFLSTLYSYKNPDKILMAFAKLKHEKDIPHNLVFIGDDPQGNIGELKVLANRLEVSKDVFFSGDVSYEDIPEYYKNADVFVHPSNIESFGLPLLEAMASGVPIVASNRTAMPEIVGDAGIIVEPNNIDELAKAVSNVIKNDKLRKSLIEKGYERVKSFKWKDTAIKTLAVIKQVVNE